MMPRLFIVNEKAAAVRISDGLNLIRTTTVQPPRKDRTDVYYHIRPVPFKAL